MKIEKDFYLREDVIEISKELLGKVLVTDLGGGITSGIIVETEAYMAPEDKASHAWNGRRTARTEIFYCEGGRSYVYLCYGIHNLFNIITNKADIPHAILIRAAEPVEGIDLMLHRRKKTKKDFSLTSGPGSLSLAFGISKIHNNIDITGSQIWIEDKGLLVKKSDIVAGPRIGVDYAGEWASRPMRFTIRDNPWVSRSR
jgi:DNA-3-methyladenine glycosylase